MKKTYVEHEHLGVLNDDAKAIVREKNSDVVDSNVISEVVG